MSTYSMTDSMNPDHLKPEVFEHEKAQLCLMPMGLTSENVSEKFGITRERQDNLALISH